MKDFIHLLPFPIGTFGICYFRRRESAPKQEPQQPQVIERPKPPKEVAAPAPAAAVAAETPALVGQARTDDYDQTQRRRARNQYLLGVRQEQGFGQKLKLGA